MKPKTLLHIAFFVLCGLISVQIGRVSGAIPPPYQWNRLQAAYMEAGDGVPVSFLPSWQTRYALYGGRFEGVDVFDFAEVRKGHILPYQKIWVMDVGKKMFYYKNELKKFYRVHEKPAPDRFRIYQLTPLRPYSRIQSVMQAGFELDGAGTFPPARGLFNGQPRKVLQIEVRKDQERRMRIRRPERAGRLHFYAGFDDVELLKDRGNQTEIEIEVSSGDQVLAQFKVIDRLGMQGRKIDLGNSAKEDVVVRFKCIHGESRKCSFQIFFTAD